MVERVICAVCAAVALTFTAPSLTRSTAASRCSKIAIPDVQPAVSFVGTATADTVPAGWAGAQGVERVQADTLRQKLAGQIFDVERVGGTAAPLLPDPVRRALVVPWSYGADCRPTPWADGLWTTPGDRGYVWGLLRDRPYWVGGVPTIDMHLPYDLPYPIRGVAGMYENPLSPDEVFDLVSVLPPTESADSLWLQPLLRWARANPELAGRYPAETAISLSLGSIERERVRAIQPEFGGTWRFSFDPGDGEVRAFYVRTVSRATAPHGRQEDDRAWIRELRPPVSPSYSLWALSAGALGELGFAPTAPGGYVLAEVSPQTLADGTRVWRASVEFNVVSTALWDDAVVRGLDAVPRSLAGLREYAQANLLPAGNGSFRLHPDGRATFEQVLVLAGRTATLRGERISLETAPAQR